MLPGSEGPSCVQSPIDNRRGSCLRAQPDDTGLPVPPGSSHKLVPQPALRSGGPLHGQLRCTTECFHKVSRVTSPTHSIETLLTAHPAANQGVADCLRDDSKF